MGAEYLFHMKSIETNARAFLALIILPIGTVTEFVNHNNYFDNLTKFDMYQANRKMMEKSEKTKIVKTQ